MANITYIELSKLLLPEFEAHKEIPEDTILEITESIKSLGILEPLIVRPHDDEFEIVVGCIRYRCAKLAGLKTAPCIISELDDKEAEIVKLHENVKRLPLDHVDQGNTFVMMREKFSMSEKDIALSFGKSPGYISQHISLVSQDEELVSAVRDNRLTFSQAREIMTVEDKPFRKYLLNTCEVNGLTVELIRRWINDHKNNLLLNPPPADSGESFSSIPETPQYLRACQACDKPTDIKDIRQLILCSSCDTAIRTAILEEKSRNN